MVKKSMASPAVAPTTPSVGGEAGGSTSSPPHIEAEVSVTPPTEGVKNPATSEGAGNTRVEASADDTQGANKMGAEKENAQPSAPFAKGKAAAGAPGPGVPPNLLTKDDILCTRQDAISAMAGRAKVYFEKLQEEYKYLHESAAVSLLFILLLCPPLPYCSPRAFIGDL
jgi:hypothetical protein